MIVIIDYGMGNLGSISNMIKKIGFKSQISSDPNIIKNATKIILPGVGTFDNGIKNIRDYGLLDILNQKVLVEKIPILGICLGMQLMTCSSDEGVESGLGWIEAYTKKFFDNDLKTPHMGWNVISHHKQSKLFDELETEKRFYFVHSYYVDAGHNADVLSVTSYGHDFVSSFEKDNIVGVQFHPEKSHVFGMKLLKNFVERY